MKMPNSNFFSVSKKDINKSKIYLEIEENGWIICSKESYIKMLEKKVEKMKVANKSTPTPSILEQSPYKLHISLQASEYDNYRDEIKAILITQMENGAINEFKFINQKVLRNKMENIKTLLELLPNYQKQLMTNEEIKENMRELKFAFKAYFNYDLFFASDVEKINEIIEHLKVALAHCQWLYDGDQFAIYIPEGYDKDKILNLCADITIFLKKNNATPGKSTDVESPLGDYIVLRQEYLMEVFIHANSIGFIDDKDRIYAAKEDDIDKKEIDRRKRVVTEQEGSDLYKHISSKLANVSELTSRKDSSSCTIS